MPYDSDEIKKWLDEAVKKIQAENKETEPAHKGSGVADAPIINDAPIAEATPIETEMPIGDVPAVEKQTLQEDASGNQLSLLTTSQPPATQQRPQPPATQQRSQPPATQQRPQPPATQQRPQPPATQQRPQPPATQQRSQPPAMQQRPQPPATQQRAQPPATQQRPQPPATQQRPAYPPAPKKPLDIRMSVADEPPRTDLSPATPPAPPMTTEKHSRPKYFDVSFEEVHEGIEKKEPEFDTGPEDFKMKFDFDSAYRDVPEERPLRVRREKRTGCLGGMLYSAFVICVSLVLASLAWLAASDVLGFNAPYEAVTMTVPKEFSIDDVVDSLFDAGLIKYKFLFKIYANFSHAEDKITAGSYILYKNFDYRALVYGMTKWEGELVETTVTLPEGFTLSDIFTRLEDHRVCTAAELWEAAANYDFKYSFLNKSTLGDPHRLEGYLFPDTYNFFLDSSPESVINKLLGEFNRRFTETYIERTADMGYSIKDIITIASMIEREAGSDEERPRIAAVIYNRLEHPEDYPFLQIDATYVYAALGTGRLPTVDIDSPYNTYLHEGLPPGPISNPGIESIRAALYPDSTDEYFYALNREGTHAFFKTQAQHEAFVASDDYGGR